MSKRKRKAERRKKSTRHTVGAVPGTLSAPPDALPTRVRVIAYDAQELVEGEGVEAIAELHGRRVIWVDVVGLQSTDVIRAIGERFDLHPLALEDVVNPHQRPKIEEYPSAIYVVKRVARAEGGELDLEQVSMFLGDGFVLTFQEREGDAYEPVRARLREARGRIRRLDAAYLSYALLDAAVDAMFPLLDVYDRRLEALEEQVFEDAQPAIAEEVHAIDRDLRRVRRAVLPMREALGRLIRDDTERLDAEVRIYLRDCQDHLAQMVDLLDAQRELSSAISAGYQSALSQRTNDRMNLLTIMSTIFIPLGFLSGLYGMNFDPGASPYNMPELSTRYGYPALLTVMVVLALGMLAFFRRRGWL